jgi:short subunit dehydrogenase-like uncharacterized protein
LQKAARLQTLAMKLPGLQSVLRKLSSFSKSQGAGPDAEARATSKSLILAETFDKDDNLMHKAELFGANGYDFTADMIAWIAGSISNGKLKSSGALGPVEAFGVEEVIDGCEQAGLKITMKE